MENFTVDICFGPSKLQRLICCESVEKRQILIGVSFSHRTVIQI